MSTAPLLRALRVPSGIVLVLGVFACAPLTDVAKFSQLSSETAQYTRLIEFTEGGYERLASAHLDPRNLATEKATNEAFKKTRPDLERIHDAVASYMAILGKLADPSVPSKFDKPLDELSKAIGVGGKAYGFTIDKTHLEAYTAISKIAARWVAGAISQREIRSLLEPEIAGHVQVLLKAMRDIAAELKKQLDDEIRQTRNALITYYEIPKRRASEPLAASFAEDSIASRVSTLQGKTKEFDAFDKAMVKISSGLTELSEHRSRLEDKEVVARVQQLWKDLHEAYSQLKKL